MPVTKASSRMVVTKGVVGLQKIGGMNMKTKSMRLALGAVLALTLMCAPVRAIAQEDIGSRIIPSLEYDQADVREALRALFRTVGVSYSIAPDVQGSITVSLKNVQFAVALENILKQVDAT